MSKKTTFLLFSIVFVMGALAVAGLVFVLSREKLVDINVIAENDSSQALPTSDSVESEPLEADNTDDNIAIEDNEYGQNQSVEQVETNYEELIFAEDANNNVVIVLSEDGNVIKKIPVGREPHDIAVSSDYKYVATANQGDGTVSVIDVRNLRAVKTMKTGQMAHGVVFDPNNRFLFVSNSGEDTLSVIDIETFGKQVKVPVGDFPEYVGVTNDGKYVFTTNLGGKGSVTLLEETKGVFNVVKEFNPGVDPHGWAVSPDGEKVVITNLGSNSTYLLNTETFEESGAINTLSTTEFAAFRSDKELWVTNIGSHYISIIDIDKNEVMGRIEVGEKPHGIAFSLNSDTAFVPLYDLGEMIMIDANTREIKNRVRIGRKLHNTVVARREKPVE